MDTNELAPVNADTATVLPEIARKGSQRWLQVAVNRAVDVINRHLRSAIPGSSTDRIEWLSPLAAENYVEYRDGTFVETLGITLRKPLTEFWPTRGPMWDGLATVGENRVLVEAKGHIGEMISGASRASTDSKKLIEDSLLAVRRILAPRNEVEWSHWNGAFYQYANRLAHLQFLNEWGDHPVHLVYVYFLNANDVHGPSTIDEWNGAIKLVDGYLGLGQHRLQRFVHKTFVDVNEVCAAAGMAKPHSAAS